MKFAQFALLCLLAVPPAEAATRTWTGNGDGKTWSDANNWSDSTVPNAQGDVAVFQDIGMTSSFAIELDQDVTLGKIQANATGNVIIDGSFDAGQGNTGFRTITIDASGSQSGNTHIANNPNGSNVSTLTIGANVLVENVDNNRLYVNGNGGSIVFDQPISQSSGSAEGLRLATSNGAQITLPDTDGGLTGSTRLDRTQVQISTDNPFGSGTLNFGNQDGGSATVVTTTDVTLANDINITHANNGQGFSIADGSVLSFTTNSVTNTANNTGVFDLGIDSNSPTGATLEFTGDALNVNANVRLNINDSELTLRFNPANAGTQSWRGGLFGSGNLEVGAEGQDPSETGQVTIRNPIYTGETNVRSGGHLIVDSDSNANVGFASLGTINLEDNTQLDLTGDDVTVTTINAANNSTQIAWSSTELTLGTVTVGGDSSVNVTSDTATVTTLNMEDASTGNTLTLNGGTVSFTNLNVGDKTTIDVERSATITNLTTSGDVSINLTANNYEFTNIQGEGTVTVSGGDLFSTGQTQELIVGNLTNAGDLEFAAASDVTFDLSDVRFSYALIAPDETSSLTFSGTEIIMGQINFSDFQFILNSGFETGATYTLMTFDDEDVDGIVFESQGFLAGQFLANLVLDGTGVGSRLLLVVVPEPTSGSLVMLALGGWLLRRRQRR